MSTDVTAMRTVTTLIRVKGEEFARVQVPAESTGNEHLVIAPSVTEHGTWRGWFMLLHVPTGLAVSRGGGVDALRDLGTRLADLDWSFTDPDSIPPALTEAAAAVMRAAALTDPSGAELPAYDAWGPDGKGKGLHRLALPMIGDFLSDYRRAHEKTWGKDGEEPEVPMVLPDSATPENPRGEHNPEWTYLTITRVHTYGLAYLLAALHRIDPEVGDSAAASLADAWEAGDSVGEWAWQWGQELAAGRSLTLPGIPGELGEVFPDTTQES